MPPEIVAMLVFMGIPMTVGVLLINLDIDIPGTIGSILWNYRIKRSERHLSAYERLARAEEREGDHYLGRRHYDIARMHFPEAEKMRHYDAIAKQRMEHPCL